MWEVGQKVSIGGPGPTWSLRPIFEPAGSSESQRCGLRMKSSLVLELGVFHFGLSRAKVTLFGESEGNEMENHWCSWHVVSALTAPHRGPAASSRVI